MAAQRLPTDYLGFIKTDTPGMFCAGSFWLVRRARQHGYFGNTDEAMSLYYGSSPAAVSAIPRSILMGRFGGNPPVGAYYYLYKNLPAALQEERFYPSLKPYKLIANPPDDVLRDPTATPSNQWRGARLCQRWAMDGNRGTWAGHAD